MDIVYLLVPLSVVLVFAIVVVGGITRLTESGLSITEWKPIRGVIPPLNEAQWQAEFAGYKAIPQYQAFNRGMTLDGFKHIYFWEYLHRLLARTIGTVLGLVLLALGGDSIVKGASGLAQRFGASPFVAGLVLIAFGTSLPELATSVMAALRGERDLAVGNIVGSNLFNLLFVLGAATAIAPDGIAVSGPALNFDLPVMTAVAAACLPIFFTGHCIQRWEGALFLGYYVAYTAYLLLDAADHDALPAFSAMMMAFVVPLTVITLLVVTVRAWRERHPRH